MGFILTIVLLVVIPAAFLSSLVVRPLFRQRKPYAKPLAVVAGVVLLLVFAWGGFVLLVAGSGQLGHPF